MTPSCNEGRASLYSSLDLTDTIVIDNYSMFDTIQTSVDIAVLMPKAPKVNTLLKKGRFSEVLESGLSQPTSFGKNKL